MSSAAPSTTSSTLISLSQEGTVVPNQPASPENKTDAVQTLDEPWDSDPRNPRNWSFRHKYTVVAIVSMYSFLPPLSSSMMAPGLPGIAEKYHIKNDTILSMTLSIFSLSFGIGPLVLAPLSEIYGRTWILHIANIFLVAFNLGCAFAPNAGWLIGFRLLSGVVGSVPASCAGGSIGDLFSERDRASAMSIHTFGVVLGPVLGPVCGGFIAQTVGVRYIFIAVAGACTIAGICGISLLRETYAPVIRLRIAAQLGDAEKSGQYQAGLVPAGDGLHFLWINLTRPIIILSRSFICFALSLYMAFTYGIYYLLFTTFANFFEKTYGFGPGIGGLAYLGLGIGFFSSTFLAASFSDRVYQYLAGKNGGKGTPEMRIPALFLGSFFVPVGLFWYGWSAQAKIHWVMPIIGSGIFGFGMIATYISIALYLVDTFTYAASALAAATVFRSLLGFAFPLFGQQMFHVLGFGGGSSLLGGLAIILGIPFPLYIYYYGEAIRKRSPLAS
ncbi:multidrug resistance protein 4 [Mycena polygramma]|nr:multidrug resistance protein 4 [Mycena polygramma]